MDIGYSKLSQQFYQSLKKSITWQLQVEEGEEGALGVTAHTTSKIRARLTSFPAKKKPKELLFLISESWF